MAYSLIPQHDPPLANRVKRQLMALMSYLMFVIPLVYAVEHGWMRFGYAGLGWFMALAIAINAGFFLAIRHGATQRFADPSVTTAQVAVAGLLALCIAYYAAEAAVIGMALFFACFFFGVFSFSLRQYLALTVAAALGYALMLALKYDADQRGSEAFRLELLNLMVLALVLLWMSLLGSYVAGLRSNLAHKKEALAAALARLKELASRDVLTGLHNRRHLMESLEQQHERAIRHGEPFSLCILDLDHFKRINDAHGHGIGDEVLCGFAERIRSQLRCMDLIGRGTSDSTFGRYGGEEFLLLLPYAEGSGARACLERLRAAMASDGFATGIGPLPITFSAGVAHYRMGETIAELVNRADAALYRAKSGGRDRVEIAD